MSAEHDPAAHSPPLLPQPAEGDPLNALELINRYGTYEIQPTADSHQFFPAIAQGSYDSTRLHRLRLQSTVDTRRFARSDSKRDKQEFRSE